MRGSGSYGTDVLTPKDTSNTYYSWGVSRNYRVADPRQDAMWATAIKTAFGAQDKPMIQAQQHMLARRGGHDIEDVDFVFLRTDAGPTRCRKVLRELIAQQRSGVLAVPRNPSLRELLEHRNDGERIAPLL